MHQLWRVLLAVGFLAVPMGSSAEETSPHSPSGAAPDLSSADKSQYTICHPTPRSLLREVEALYKSPYTVDAGHLQTETYVVGYVYDRDTARGADTVTKIWRLAPTTFKLGMLNNLDLELEIAPHTRVRTEDRVAGTVTTRSGFGDLTTKVKLNVCGNDNGSFALALLPFVKFPTGQRGLGNNAFEGGLTMPISVELPLGWWLGLSPELSFFQNSDGHGYSPAFANTAYLWHAIAGKLSGYVEFSNWVGFEHTRDWVGTADLGLTYLVGKNVQLDAGLLLGVTRAAPDVNPFLGVSFRF